MASDHDYRGCWAFRSKDRGPQGGRGGELRSGGCNPDAVADIDNRRAHERIVLHRILRAAVAVFTSCSSAAMLFLIDSTEFRRFFFQGGEGRGGGGEESGISPSFPQVRCCRTNAGGRDTTVPAIVRDHRSEHLAYAPSRNDEI